MSEHTPGPWKVYNSTDVFQRDPGQMNAEGIEAAPNDGWHIANCAVGWQEIDGEQVYLSLREQEANAAHIVKCVNSHERLVEAAKAAVDAWHDDDRNFDREMEDGTPEWLAKCRAAIRAAEGGE